MKPFDCAGCGQCTLSMREHFRTTKDLWEDVGGPRALCVGCVEKRIGRKLLPKDFPAADARNSCARRGSIRVSPRLRDRLGLPPEV